MNIDIKYYNDKDPSNGYQAWYFGDGNNDLISRCNCKHNIPYGYCETHYVTKQTLFYIR